MSTRIRNTSSSGSTSNYQQPPAAAAAASEVPAQAAAATAATLTGDGQRRQDDLPQPGPGDEPAHAAWSAVAAAMPAATLMCRTLTI